MFETGRVCLKTAGREAGKYCVIVNKIDQKFVLVTGPKELTKVKRRKCNMAHLEPLPYKLKIAADASDAEVLKVFASEGILEKLDVKQLSKEELKARHEAKAEKAKEKAERAKREEKAKPKEEKIEKPKPEVKPKEIKPKFEKAAKKEEAK